MNEVHLNINHPVSSASAPVPPGNHWRAAPEPGPAGSDRRTIIDPGEADGIVRYLQVAARNWYLLAAFGLICASAGFVATLFQNVLYRSQTLVELQGVNENFMDMDKLDPQAGTGRFSSDQANIGTHLKLIETTSLSNRVVESLSKSNLRLGPPPEDGLDRMRRLVGRDRQKNGTDLRAGLSVAKMHVVARPVPNTRLVTIACDSTHPELSARFINQLLEEHFLQSLSDRRLARNRTTAWLSEQVDVTKTKLESAEHRLQAFVRETGSTFATSDPETLVETKLKQLKNELSVIQAERIAKQSRHELFSQGSAESLPEVLGDSVLSSYFTQVTDLRRQLAEANISLGAAHPKIKKIEAQLEEVNNAIDKQRLSIVDRVRGEYRAAQKREHMLAEAYAGQTTAFTRQAVKAAEYGMLKREEEIARQSYNSVLRQYDQISIASALPTNHLRIVEQGAPSPIAIKPDPAVNTAFGGALGLMAGFLLACGRDFSGRHRVRVRGQMATMLRLPELGVVPSAELLRSGRLGQAKAAVFGSGPMRLLSSGDTPAVELTAHARRGSPVSESIRLALHSIEMPREGRRTPQIVIVASPGGGEGKTTICCNLGIAMAQTKRRVLIIDADIRRPRLAALFDLEETPGLTGIIRSTTPIEAFIPSELAQPTSVPGLFVLPAGAAANDLYELLHSPRLGALLQRMRREYDFVLIDTPPLVPFADAHLLCRFSDGVVLVARHMVTESESLMLAADILGRSGAPIIGTILNDWKPTFGEARRYEQHYGRYYADSMAD